MTAPDPATYRDVFAALPAPVLVLDPGLVIVDANPAYLAMVGRPLDELVGRYVLDAFPDESGGGALESSLLTVLRTGRPDRLPVLRYRLRAPGTHEVEDRWWSIVNLPLLDAGREVSGVLNVAEDITQVVLEQRQSRLAQALAEDLQRQSELLTSDLASRSQALSLMHEAEARASRRLAALAEVALELASAESVEQMTEVVVGRGLTVLGADGGAVGVVDEARTHLRLDMTDSLGSDSRRLYAEIPLDGPLPAAVAARTGRPVLLGDRAAGLAFSPEMAQVYATAGREAWAAIPLSVGTRTLGSITVGWDTAQSFLRADVELLSAFAAQCAQALERLLRRQAERETAAVAVRMSEALQRSLLTEPVQPDHLQIVARYVPAAHDARVGGDWYDAFFVSDGSTQLVVGDVAGHDRDAAAAMAQVRNVLRGIAHSLVQSPAMVLTALDHALEDLAVGAMTTAVLAKIEQTEDDADAGLRVLRWSNAGHPPPLLVEADGEARLLEALPDLVLGVRPATPRHDHTQVLRPGATLLFYTDGLVERRHAPLTEGLEWLRRTVSGYVRRGLTLEELCDALLGELTSGVEDDVALLAVRAHPEDGPRPQEAGPAVLPHDLAERSATP